VSTPDPATLTSGTVATIAAAARAIYLYDASLDDVYARAKEPLDKGRHARTSRPRGRARAPS
jgi:hypothetical protein